MMMTTKDAVRAALFRYIRTFGEAAAAALLESFGADRVSALDPKDYAAVIVATEKTEGMVPLAVPPDIGATAEEIATALDIPIDEVAARLDDLRSAGLIELAGVREVTDNNQGLVAGIKQEGLKPMTRLKTH
jgi:hypothetical protein